MVTLQETAVTSPMQKACTTITVEEDIEGILCLILGLWMFAEVNRRVWETLLQWSDNNTSAQRRHKRLMLTYKSPIVQVNEL